MAYTYFHTNPHESGHVGVPGLRDPDGNIIYETEYRALLQTIVTFNDVATLKRYIEINPKGPLCPAEVYSISSLLDVRYKPLFLSIQHIRP